MGPLHWDNTISAGNIITIIGFLVAGIIAWSRVGYRVDTIEKWIEKHEQEVQQREILATSLNTSVAVLTTEIKGLNERLQGLEFSANRERRNRRA